MLSRYRYFLVLIAAPMFFTCGKDEAPLPVVPDNIVYTDIIPDTSITSVKSYTSHPSGCGQIPSADSTAYYRVDVDGDSIDDIQVSVSHYYHLVSVSNPCSNYAYGASVSSLNSHCFVSRKNDLQSNYLFSYGETISTGNSWLNSTHLWSSYGYGYGGDKYVGIKIEKAGEKYIGWILITKEYSWKFTVKGFAINYADSKPILAGQVN